MSAFVCSKCGMMDNTAVTHYWTRKRGAPALCSACDPDIGQWHGRFDRKPLPPECAVGPDGFVYHKDDPYLRKLIRQAKDKGARP